jgi:hypothetical protein
MTPLEMALACKRVIESPFGLRSVAFVLPRTPGRGRRMRLAGPESPLGEVACVNADGHTVCHFDAIDVLAWLSAKDLVDVQVTTSDPSATPPQSRPTSSK